MPGKYIIIKKHRAEFDAIDFYEGDMVSITEKKTIYKGWKWCIRGDMAAWIPVRYLSPEGKKFRLNRDYNSRELSINLGEIVILIEKESGWALVRTTSEQIGWVPVENIKLSV